MSSLNAFLLGFMFMALVITWLLLLAYVVVRAVKKERAK